MSGVKVKGLSELNKFLQEMPVKMEKNVLRAALRAGGNVIRDEAKLNVPVKSGVLRDGLKVSTRNKWGAVTATVKTTGKHSFIAQWVEFGTAAHNIKPRQGGKGLSFGGLFAASVDHPGSSAKPFLRPALDNKAGAAVVAVGNAIKKRLTKQGLNTAHIEVEAE